MVNYIDTSLSIKTSHSNSQHMWQIRQALEKFVKLFWCKGSVYNVPCNNSLIGMIFIE